MKLDWTFDSASAFERYRDDWQSLNARNEGTPLLDPKFVAPLLNHFSDGNEILAIGRASDKLGAMAILTRRGFGKWNTFQPSQAPLGLIVHRNELSITALSESLAGSLQGIVLVLDFMQQDPDLTPRPEDTARTRTKDHIQTARITVCDTFDEYWNSCDKKMRRNVKWRRNRLAKLGLETRLEVFDQKNQMEQGVEDYGRLESGGWKGREGTAVNVANAQGRYYTEMLEAFSEAGQARIYRYWIGDQVVASDLCIIGQGTLIVLKVAYNEEFSTHAPSILMREEQVRQIFEKEDIHTIEFYGRVVDWHTKWTNDFRTIYHLSSYRWPLLASLSERGK